MAIHKSITRDMVASFYPKDYFFDPTDVIHTMPYTMEEIRSKCRKQDLKEWRQILAVYLYMKGYSGQETGMMIGRDNATVIHSCKMVANAMEGYHPSIREKIEKLNSPETRSIMNTEDVQLNESISLVFIESQFLKKFPNLASHCYAF